jgi:uncharacterized iron-regulated membrane protein
METAMNGSFDKSGKSYDDVRGHWNVGFLALPALVLIALAGLAVMHPAASNWISDAVQAEFVGIAPAPEAAPSQMAQPAREVRTVKAD